MAVIYVGCALSDAPQEFKEEVVAFKQYLRMLGHEVLEFVLSKEATPESIYKNDIELALKNCDIFIAILDYASTGLGMEIGFALGRFRKPTLMVVHTKHQYRISKLPRGAVAMYGPELLMYRTYGHLQWVADLYLSDFLQIADFGQKSLPLE